MTTTTERPNIFSLPVDERREAYADAAARAIDAAHQAAVAYKAKNKPDPRAQQYRLWNTLGLVCVLVVKHQDKPASIECSRDGGYPHVYLPSSKSLVQPESTDEFALIVVPKWLAQRADLMGVTLPLSATRTWSDAQCAIWARLDRLRSSIITRIYFGNRRKASNLKRNDAA